MPKQVEHTRREMTPEGEQRFVKASRMRGVWRVSSKLKSDEIWTHHDEDVSEADLRNLRDVLWRKYQRKRVAWEHVAELDTLLGDGETN